LLHPQALLSIVFLLYSHFNYTDTLLSIDYQITSGLGLFTMARIVSVQEISKHNIPEDIWIVVDDTVYDMTEFAPEHPGGAGSKFPSSPKLSFPHLCHP
jgi:cytochrome b involved in lipid metabolism